MSDCIEALITANLKTAVETVTVAGGYNTNCGTVEEMRSMFAIPGEAQSFTLIQKLPYAQEEDYQHSQDGKTRYRIYYFNGSDDSGSNNPIQYTDRNVAADFQKAIMSDRTRGGNAQNTTIEEHGQGFFFGTDEIVIPCTYLTVCVDYLVNADNPYQLA